MIDCYGCQHPMNASFRAYDRGVGEVFPYCVVCWVVLKLSRATPGDHEPGTLSNGTPTMRRRSPSNGGDR